jgi:hypothetical protein
VPPGKIKESLVALRCPVNAVQTDVIVRRNLDRLRQWTRGESSPSARSFTESAKMRMRTRSFGSKIGRQFLDSLFKHEPFKLGLRFNRHPEVSPSTIQRGKAYLLTLRRCRFIFTRVFMSIHFDNLQIPNVDVARHLRYLLIIYS